MGVKDKPSPISASPRKRVTIGAASIAGAKAEGNDERKAEAWRLRVEKGWTYRKIGAELGVDHVTAMKWCHAARDAHAETAADKIATVTEAAIERLTRAAAIAHEEYDRDRMKLRRAGEVLGVRFTFASIEPMLESWSRPVWECR